MRTFLTPEPVFSSVDFVGRRVELDWLQDKISRDYPQNCNIIGEPRSGKTSLLYHVYTQKLGLLPGEHGLFVWLRLLELPTPNRRDFWQALLARLCEELETGGWEFVVETPAPPQPYELFLALDQAVGRLVEEAGMRRIVFLIDDFHVLRDVLQSEDLDWLRALATRHDEWISLVISSTDPLTEITAGMQTESPLTNVFYNRWLSLLSPQEARELVELGAQAEGAERLSEQDVDFLLREAGRHPALLKIACGFFFEAQRLGAGEHLHVDVQGDLRFDGQAAWLFRQLYERRRPTERDILRRLTAGEADIAEQIVLNRLERHVGVVEMRNGRPVLFADAFHYWLTGYLRVEARRAREREALVEMEETAVAAQLPPASRLHHRAEQRIVQVNGQEVSLTLLENRLLAYFFKHAEEVCTANQLLSDVWGPNRTLAVVEKGVNRLRAKIEQEPERPRYILSARGEGYLFRPSG